MKTFSKPFHELGGVFIDFKANRARALTIRNNVGIQLISAADGIEEADPAPGRRAGVERDVVARRHGDRVLRPRRRRDAHLDRRRRDRQVAAADEDAGARDARHDSSSPTDGKQIAAVLVPDGAPPMPPAPTAPTGPTVKLADADKNRLRTFPSLMSTPYEKELLEWHATGQVALIDVQKGAVKKFGQPAMMRVDRLRRPTASTCA